FVQFLQQRPDDGIYELVNGEIVKVEAIRARKNVARYLVKSFDRESERLGLDYIDKLEEYENLGIKEYWIVDYLAIASRSYLGNPKLPTVFVYQLVD
ncbi:MAG: Uma2 family endonuclease, partial [Dolichospermum sp.]